MFEVKTRDGLARIGRLATRHGVLETPTLLPVVNPRRMTLSAGEIRDCGATGLITNSYIISRHEEVRERALAEGVHALLEWDGPLMTDSGTFQSHVYGDVEIAPQAIVEFQRDIGSDIGTVLDVFTEPEFDAERAESELAETQTRIEAAVPLKGEMLLAATVQGGIHPELRERAASLVSGTESDVHPIGGVVPLMEQYRYGELAGLILAAKRALVPSRPVHLFGCGHPSLFALATLLGCDLFDSASYAKFAADGRMMFSWGTRRLAEMQELPCGCAVCSATTAKELQALPDAERERQLARHNLLVSFAELRQVREAVRGGQLWELVVARAAGRPEVADALVALEAEGEWLEKWEPAFRPQQPTSAREPLRRFVKDRLHHAKTSSESYNHPFFGAIDQALADTAPLRPPGNVRQRSWTPERVHAIASYQFGSTAADALMDGDVELVTSRNTGRLRNVIVDGEHRLSLSARHGLFTLRAAGACVIHATCAAPQHRVVVHADSAEFNRQGRNAFCKFVLECDPELHCQDECLIVTESDELVAIGKLKAAPVEIALGQQGLAVKVREAV